MKEFSLWLPAPLAALDSLPQYTSHLKIQINLFLNSFHLIKIVWKFKKTTRHCVASFLDGRISSCLRNTYKEGVIFWRKQMNALWEGLCIVSSLDENIN